MKQPYGKNLRFENNVIYVEENMYRKRQALPLKVDRGIKTRFLHVNPNEVLQSRSHAAGCTNRENGTEEYKRLV